MTPNIFFDFEGLLNSALSRTGDSTVPFQIKFLGLALISFQLTAVPKLSQIIEVIRYASGFSKHLDVAVFRF